MRKQDFTKILKVESHKYIEDFHSLLHIVNERNGKVLNTIKSKKDTVYSFNFVKLQLIKKKQFVYLIIKQKNVFLQ